MMYWADETRFGPTAQKSDSVNEKQFYIDGYRTPWPGGHSDYDP